MTREVRVRGEALSRPVYWTGRQWAVTAYGIERRDGLYAIEKARLWEDHGVWGWEKHIAEKEWADVSDFLAALAVARLRWPAKSQP